MGKTTVATALATLAAREGQSVLLAQFESNVDAGTLLGQGPVGTELREIAPRLHAVNMTPRSALRQYGMLIFRMRAIQRAVMENRMVKHFLNAIPGLDDYSMLGKAWFHTTEIHRGRPRYDLVVVDGPATGQMLKVLGVPRTILEVVPDSMLSRDARTIHGFITDPVRTTSLVVTLAEELPVTEALELELALRDTLKLDVAGLVINALYPRRRCPELLDLDASEFAADEMLAALFEQARVFAQRRAINEHHLGVLGERSATPLMRLPRLFKEIIGATEIARLADVLHQGGQD